jgi:NhaA family Na+:H+ antiporter
VGVLAGIGFTISLFITLLALGEHSPGEAVAKLAILLASVVAGVLGYVLLRTLPAPKS